MGIDRAKGKNTEIYCEHKEDENLLLGGIQGLLCPVGMEGTESSLIKVRS